MRRKPASASVVLVFRCSRIRRFREEPRVRPCVSQAEPSFNNVRRIKKCPCTVPARSNPSASTQYLRASGTQLYTPQRPDCHRNRPGGSQRPNCVAEVVGLELGNVVAKYAFERSHGFPGIQPNSDHRDYSRLSCAVWETQLGPNARCQQGCLRGGRSIAEGQELPRFSADPEMIRRRPNQQHHCSLCAGL